MYKQEIYDSFDCLDIVHIIDDVGNNSSCSSDRIWDSPLRRNRKLWPMELKVMDLQDCLRKHRVIDGLLVVQSSRRHGSSHLLGLSREKPQRLGVSQRLHGRLASEVGKDVIESLNGILLNEEKKKAKDNGDYIGKTGNLSRMALADFKCPKPLSEILKDKR
ncbi:hypothetical protein GH714_016535 [Hevea brasiliensis]|uniref:Uncharacterized protein n=1 Tax=Hevea brasiliensis TaxID=3981 RepID=A0A6A6KLN5_HEVBR|nr:hypothetical protein GH714_016535 [Hevea brasiliensis]